MQEHANLSKTFGSGDLRQTRECIEANPQIYAALSPDAKALVQQGRYWRYPYGFYPLDPFAGDFVSYEVPYKVAFFEGERCYGVGIHSLIAHGRVY